VLAGVLGAGLALAVAGAGASGASAHDFLESTNPAADSVVTEALAEVSLRFNEPPLTDLGAGIAVEVHDPSGADVAGALSIVDSTLSVPVTLAATGGYTVLWQTVSSDGHPVSGEFGFDYQGPVATPEPITAAPDAPTSPTPEATTPAPTPAATTSAPAAVPSATSTAVADSPGGGAQLPLVLVGLLAAVALIGVLAAVLLLARRRNRPAGK
jgi:methionine-rich copper-binding protein CopC